MMKSHFLAVSLASAMCFSTILGVPTTKMEGVGQALGGRNAGMERYQQKPALHQQKPIFDTPKYFSEPGVGEIYGHYDLRYYNGQPVAEAEREIALHLMIRAYLITFQELQIDTWLAHGTLLGWYWNKKILPWDGDIDVQVWASSLYDLADKWNMTQFEYSTSIPSTAAGGSGRGSTEIQRRYLLDINPNHVERVRGNWMNVIDARWIDLETGLFVDITGLSELDPGTGVWTCKNQHSYRIADLTPMVESTFEGVRAMVPRNSVKVLKEEYRAKALTLERYEGHKWDKTTSEWVKDLDLLNPTGVNDVWSNS